MLLAVLAENGVDEFTHPHRRSVFHVQLVAGGTQLGYVHPLDIHAGIFLDGIQDADPAVGSLEIHVVPGDVHHGGTVHGQGDLLQHLLHEFHHPQVVLVGDVNLHAGELGIMGLVHAFVAEVFSELINPVVAAHDKSFEVKLIGDTHVQGNIQRVVVGDERTGRRAARNRLQDGRFHLQAAGCVEVFAHGGDDLRPFDEHLFHLRVHNQVHIPLAVAQFRIGKAVVDGSVRIGLHDGQHAQRFAQQHQLAGVNAQLPGLGDEGKAFDADDVTDVQQLLEHGVVQGLILAGADIVPLYIYLDAAGGILELHKGSGSHDAPRHDAARDADVLQVPFFGIVFLRDSPGGFVNRIQGCRIRINTQFLDFRQGFPAQDFLLAAFDVCHKILLYWFTILQRYKKIAIFV